MVRKITETNLRSAYAGESQAHMRYTIYANRAKRSGFPNVARLFTAVAFAESVHATNHYRNIKTKWGATTTSAAEFGTITTSEDLQAGINGESFEINEMYPAYKATANFQGEKAAELTFTWAWEAEKTHLDLGPIHVCEVCGYTVEGQAPERCPICNATKDRFKTFDK